MGASETRTGALVTRARNPRARESSRRVGVGAGAGASRIRRRSTHRDCCAPTRRSRCPAHFRSDHHPPGCFGHRCCPHDRPRPRPRRRRRRRRHGDRTRRRHLPHRPHRRLHHCHRHGHCHYHCHGHCLHLVRTIARPPPRDRFAAGCTGRRARLRRLPRGPPSPWTVVAAGATSCRPHRPPPHRAQPTRSRAATDSWSLAHARTDLRPPTATHGRRPAHARAVLRLLLDQHPWVRFRVPRRGRGLPRRSVQRSGRGSRPR